MFSWATLNRVLEAKGPNLSQSLQTGIQEALYFRAMDARAGTPESEMTYFILKDQNREYLVFRNHQELFEYCLTQFGPKPLVVHGPHWTEINGIRLMPGLNKFAHVLVSVLLEAYPEAKVEFLPLPDLPYNYRSLFQEKSRNQVLQRLTQGKGKEPEE